MYIPRQMASKKRHLYRILGPDSAKTAFFLSNMHKYQYCFISLMAAGDTP